MRRFATALIALFALVALVTAAGSFGGPDQPTLYSGTTPTEPMPTGPLPAGSGGENATTATDSRDVIDGETPVPPDQSGEDGGVSTLLVAGLVGGLLVAAVLAVLLTGDDSRAPPRDDDGDGDRPSEPPTPSVDPSYDSPADSAVVRAWRRLRDRVEGVDESATPGETAATAVDRGYPDDAVESVTRGFEAVRYGRRSPTDEQERSAGRLADRLDAGGDGRSEGGENA
ncbi:DUF4129 domain-containing protein [Halosimplex rubrum]|uniref:DUF4129 domain-containing protein n=1 Tax=Halosimplex rubrum TaxID=869889 RepID=A0A7D5P2D2_9EURY|nr:DUF4129 domain-containing protein [Halosimplex rubrum]QLH79223.1 DUF4129 domain-containing protein [Halosimplex rubrum]